MVPKRVKQFYINITDKMSKSDYEYVKNILKYDELELFKKLLKSEQKHSVRIAKDIEAIIDNRKITDDEILNNKELLIKTALLHDVGKSIKRINVIDKSIIVILNKLTKGNLKKLKISKKVQCYYNHSEYSYEMLKKLNESSEILNIVKSHHSNSDDKLVLFFKGIDDKN
ncbi:MAG: HDIG domain-containing metalloprotein [Peptostreptococcaceae bacterium]